MATEPLPLASLASAGPPDVDRLLEEFEESWRHGQPRSIDQFLASSAGMDAGARRRLLEELILIDLDYRWRQQLPERLSRAAADRGPALEDYLPRFPELAGPNGFSLSAVRSEYRIRRHWDDLPTHEEYLKRFPHHGSELARHLAAVDAELVADAMADGEVPLAVPIAAPVATNGMVGSVPALLDLLLQMPLLSAVQLEHLVEEERLGRFPDPDALLTELIGRGWLTAYQVDQLRQGHGADLVMDSYIVLEHLGEGGTGRVFKAWHRRLTRVVALKVIRKELLADPEVVRRFYREIRLVSELASPHIVHAYDAGTLGTTHFLTMEYVEGTDLSRLVKASGPLPFDRAADFIRQAALGLQHIHEHRLIHRDVKPSNLFLCRAPETPLVGRIKVLDLGLGRWCAAPAEAGLAGEPNSFSTFTPAGSVMVGTPDYLAPEQALDFHQADIRADIYSLGCTFFYLLAGQPPFAGGTLTQKLLRHQQEPIPPLERMRPDFPAGLGAVLNRMVAKRPEERYQTPGELADALGEWTGATRIKRTLPGKGVEVSTAPTARGLLRDPLPAGSPRNRGPAHRRSWRPALVGGAVLLVCLGVFFYLLATSLHAPEKLTPAEETASTEAPAKPPSWTLWGQSSEVPEEASDSGQRGVELGVKFKVEINGVVSGVRFYKTPRNTGRHVASLWTRTGTSLGSAVFANETASGWQQADLVPPIAVKAHTTYVASYHSASGFYAATKDYFAVRATGRGPLTALANDVDGPNGVFKYTSTSGFPTAGFESHNYWVDVVFTPVP